MNTLPPTKTAIADLLRAFATNPVHDYARAAIEGLGELGGNEAIRHIEELMDEKSNAKGPAEQELWKTLVRAYGRAGRNLPE